MQASTADYRRKRERRLAIASSIWPGPECLLPKPFAIGEYVLVVGSGYLSSGVVTRKAMRSRIVEVTGPSTSGGRVTVAVYPESLRRDYSESHRRSLGIAMALEAARARMQRFLAWIEAREACEEGYDFAAARMSPEQAVWDVVQLVALGHVRVWGPCHVAHRRSHRTGPAPTQVGKPKP
jgi:hypothetical protein